jgi:hypothetical protein
MYLDNLDHHRLPGGKEDVIQLACQITRLLQWPGIEPALLGHSAAFPERPDTPTTTEGGGTRRDHYGRFRKTSARERFLLPIMAS